MKLSNRFPDDEKMRVWSDHQYCALCSSNEVCSLHHIRGCKKECHRSIYNSIMLCQACHSVADGRNGDSPEHEMFRMQLQTYTARRIKEQDKQDNKHDTEFKSLYSTAVRE